MLSCNYSLITERFYIHTSEAYISTAAAKDGSLLVVYVPPAHKGNIDVNMAVFSKKVDAQWSDPTNAVYTVVDGAPINNKGIHSFTRPGKNSARENDWVLVIKVKE